MLSKSNHSTVGKPAKMATDASTTQYSKVLGKEYDVSFPIP
jgi:hypothetical protein